MKKILVCIIAVGIMMSCSWTSISSTTTTTNSSQKNSTVVWTKTIEGNANNEAEYKTLKVDTDGNVIVAGYITGHDTYNFGNGITISAGGSGDENLVIAKYDADGNALWANTITNATKNSRYNAIAIDNDNNIYAVGYIVPWFTNNPFWLSDTISVVGKGMQTIIIAKYSKDGILLWAKTAKENYYISTYNDISIDPVGDIFAVGQLIYSMGFGNGVVLDNASTGVLLVKYTQEGEAQWARGVVPGNRIASCYNTVTANTDGTVYAGGYLSGNGVCNFDTTHSATYESYPKENIIAVKYDSNGTILDVDPEDMNNNGSSVYNSMYIASCRTNSGEVVFVGKATSPYAYTLDDYSSVAGDAINNNGLYVKIAATGNVNGAFCGGFGETAESAYYGITVNSSDATYLVGDLSVDFSSGYHKYGLLVKVNANGQVVWGNMYEKVDGDNLSFKSVAVDKDSNIYIIGSMFSGTKEGVLVKIAETSGKTESVKSNNRFNLTTLLSRFLLGK